MTSRSAVVEQTASVSLELTLGYGDHGPPAASERLLASWNKASKYPVIQTIRSDGKGAPVDDSDPIVFVPFKNSADVMSLERAMDHHRVVQPVVIHCIYATSREGWAYGRVDGYDQWRPGWISTSTCRFDWKWDDTRRLYSLELSGTWLPERRYVDIRCVLLCYVTTSGPGLGELT